MLARSPSNSRRCSELVSVASSATALAVRTAAGLSSACSPKLGIGLLRPATVDVVRTVPELARIESMENGADFEVPDFLTEQYDAREPGEIIGSATTGALVDIPDGARQRNTQGRCRDGERATHSGRTQLRVRRSATHGRLTSGQRNSG